MTKKIVIECEEEEKDEHEEFLPFPLRKEGKRWAKKHV
jgi:hypothetical protein